MYWKSARSGVQQHLDLVVEQMYKGGVAYGEALSEFRKAFITAALRENNGNLSKTAPALGLHRNTLTRICLHLQLDARIFRTASRRPPKSARAATVARQALR